MKKVFIAISLLLLSSGSRLAAQTIMDSNTAYKEFVRLANEDTDKVLTYDALYRCYAATYAVMTTSEKTSSEYSQATYNMTHIIPFLPNAAAFYSRGMSAGNAVKFARAFVDVANLPDFADGGYRSQTAYAQLSYFAAASLVNQQQYGEAIPYLQSYIRSGEDKYRKTVFINLVKACAASNQYELAVVTLEQATENYPTDYDFVSAAVNLCIDHNDTERLQHFVTKGLALQPDDATLLNIQGKLYEEKREFRLALGVYQRLQESHPKALDVLKHLAINSYNLGVENYNKTLELREDPNVNFFETEAKEYFTQAIGHLRNILISDPLSLKYTQALAIAYICTGDKENFGLVNYKLASMGGGKIEENVIPRFIDFVQEAGPTVAAIPRADGGTQEESLAEGQLQGIPPYSAFAVPFIESRIGKWQEKDPYETLDEYRNRVTEQSREEKIQEMQHLAQREFISLYETKVNLRHLELRPYDAEHEVFLVTSPEVGEMIIPVPRSNDEAKIFASNWNGMQFKDPKYFIDNGHLAIASLTIITPSGKRYQYDNAAALNYTVTNVDVHFDPINADMLASNSSINQQTIKEQNVKLGTSDVDENIPETPTDNTRTFAVVIANQHYTNISGGDVLLALNDGEAVAKYCHQTLGMPKENVRYYADASYGTMLRAVQDIKQIAASFNGDINIVFYYAGHGIPNEQTKDAYLLPTDADGLQTEGCYSLNRLYAELGSTRAKQIVVFLDACFSGSNRGEGMLASARGVGVKPKREDPNGNMVVFSAASGDETAYPYSVKGHGLFTYYLLKKLQETQGNVTLGELGEYVSENVRQQSVVINRKPQTPTFTPSSSLAEGWRELKLR